MLRHRFVTASRTDGEYKTDFLVRIEKLSRCLEKMAMLDSSLPVLVRLMV